MADYICPPWVGRLLLSPLRKLVENPKKILGPFELAPFYQKRVVVGSFPIVGSAAVSDAALLEAGWVVKQILGDRHGIARWSVYWLKTR